MQRAVKQLTGPGVPGMEDEAPLYHFDLSMDELVELIMDPEVFLAGIDVPTSAARTILFLRWNEVYSPDEGWQSRHADDATSNEEIFELQARRPRACCTTGDGGMTCTVWK